MDLDAAKTRLRRAKAMSSKEQVGGNATRGVSLSRNGKILVNSLLWYKGGSYILTAKQRCSRFINSFGFTKISDRVRDFTHKKRKLCIFSEENVRFSHLLNSVWLANRNCA